jgi:8-oxo-dGTP diphosphatase
MQQPAVMLEVVMLRMVNGRLCVFLTSCQEQSGMLCLPRVRVDAQQDRNLDSAVRRGISELTDAVPQYVEQIKTIGNATRYPEKWMIAVVHVALFNDRVCASPNDWYPCDDLASRSKLAYDHCGVVASCVKRLRSKAKYTSLPLHLAQPEFSLGEAQAVYERLLMANLDKKSFRRRLLDADIVMPLNKTRRTSSRPAQLYTLKQGHIVHHFSRNMLGNMKGVTR